MEYPYNNLIERASKVAEGQALGLVMYHDNFDSDWQPGDEPHGTLIFGEPIPPTAEQLAEQAEREAMEKAEEMIDSISNLADAKVFLKRLCLRLFKNGALP